MKLSKKAKIIILVSVFVLMGVLIFTITGNRSTDTQRVTLYYLSGDKTAVIEYEKEIKADTDKELYENVADALLKGIPSKKYAPLAERDTKVNKITCNQGNLSIDFSSEYAEGGVLPSYAVIKTFCGLPNVKAVMVTVNGADVLGNGFVSGDEINLESDDDCATTVALYFADNDKTKLVKEYRKVNITDTRPVEQYIVAELIEGPEIKENASLFAKNTNVLSVELTDGTCYVNFEKTFDQNAQEEKDKKLLIYSLVNSLTERKEVKNVQILINGKKADKVGDINISEPLFRNEELTK